MCRGFDVNNTCWCPSMGGILSVGNQIFLLVSFHRLESRIVSLDCRQSSMIFDSDLCRRVSRISGDGLLDLVDIIDQCLAETLQLDLSVVNGVESAIDSCCLDARKSGCHVVLLFVNKSENQKIIDYFLGR